MSAETHNGGTEWRASLWRDIRSDLESRPGGTLDWRATPDGAMSIDTKGYSGAIRLLMDWVAKSPEKRRMAGEMWEVRFFIRNSEFRPTYAELEKAVRKALKAHDIAEEHPEAYNTVRAPKDTVMGLPAMAVSALYADAAMPRQNNITLAEVPTHDNEGNLIGEGRRRFLCCYHRMRGGHNPNPDKEPPLDFEGGPRPKEVGL